MKKLALCLAVLIALPALPAWAADIVWFGAAGDRDWFNEENWNADPPPPGPVPGFGDKAKVNFVWGNPGPIIAGGAAEVDRLYVAETNGAIPGAQTATVGVGGTLTSALESVMGYGSGDDGGLVLEGGIADFQQHLFVGFNAGSVGRLEINSGEVHVAQMFGLAWNGGDGYAQLNGGILHTEQFSFSNGGGIASMDIMGGEWIQEHYWVPEIEALVAAGDITGYGDPANVVVEWDPVLEQTHVYAVPEPASLLLLAVGGLMLRRRRA